MTQTAQTSLPGSGNILRHCLPNGMTILVYENHIAPTVVAGGYLWSGSQDDPLNQLGLANFTVDVMERGTVNRTFNQLYEEIESIGASFGMQSGTHTTSFGMKGLTEHLPLLLEITKDTLCNPALLPEQVEKTRAELMTDLGERIHDTPSMATLAFYELAYPASHPYHWSQLGYEHTLSAIKQPDLASFHAQHFSPEGMVIAVVGDVNAGDVVALVSDLFSGWNQKAEGRNQLPEVAPLAERHIKSVYVEDKTQSNIILGWPGPARKHPDFMPCFLANTVLGVFGMYGRLGKKVREEHSLAYYAYSSVHGGLGPGPWTINTGVDPTHIERTVSVILDDVQRLLDEPIPEDELEDSKAYLTGSLPLHLETNAGLIHSMINIERFGLGLDYLQHYKDNIMQISAQDILKAVRQWMDPTIYAMAVAGPSTYTDGG